MRLRWGWGVPRMICIPEEARLRSWFQALCLDQVQPTVGYLGLTDGRGGWQRSSVYSELNWILDPGILESWNPGIRVGLSEMIIHDWLVDARYATWNPERVVLSLGPPFSCDSALKPPQPPPGSYLLLLPTTTVVATSAFGMMVSLPEMEDGGVLECGGASAGCAGGFHPA
ncbi:hypothetical protein LIA77_01839 [Sarocladium implicatum]|nr:hypothetical protein LIA77_01839 [Sarocladium implicatum]